MKKTLIIFMIGISSVAWLVSAGFTSAATSNVSFNPATGNLSVIGACSQRFVLVLIRRASDGSIWGSSNPDCVNGSYSYETVVPTADQTGETFKVQAVDETVAGAAVPTMASGSFSGGSQPVIISAPVAQPSVLGAITIDTSSITTSTDDISFMDGLLSGLFGIVTSATDSIEHFLIAVVNLFVKNLTVLPGGSITVPQGANEMSGSAWLNAGDSSVFIANTSVTSSSKIIVTPTAIAAVSLAVTDKQDGVGFQVSVPSPQATAISFDWLIVQTYSTSQQAATQQQSSAAVSAPAASQAAIIAPPSDASDTTTDASNTVPMATIDVSNVTTTPAIVPPDVVTTTDTTSTLTVDATTTDDTGATTTPSQ